MLSLKWKNLMKALVRWATINTDSFDVVAGDFANQDSATISANDVSISADSFVNSHTLGYGSIIVDKLTLSLIEDFDYISWLSKQWQYWGYYFESNFARRVVL